MNRYLNKSCSVILKAILLRFWMWYFCLSFIRVPAFTDYENMDKTVSILYTIFTHIIQKFITKLRQTEGRSTYL